MVSSVGGISIDLSANTQKFIAGFKKSADTVDRESKRMSNAISGFSKKASGIGSAFIGGIVAGGTLAAIGSLTGAIGKARQSLSDFEEIGNRAKATGLSTDTFQAISHGASLADVEQESLNKSLEIFAKNVGLAEKGTGKLYSGLLKLNPQLLQQILNAKDQETRLKLVADAMASMTDATQKAALATTVFGKGGAEMVRVLDEGAQSIEKMKRDAAELGIIIPEELIARSGELDDKLTTLAKVIDVNISEALVKAAPWLVKGAEGMVKLAQGINQLSTSLANFNNNKSLANFLDLLKALGAPTAAIDVYKKTFTPDAAQKAAKLKDELYGVQRQMFLVGEEIKVAEAKLAEFLKHKDEPGGMFDVVEAQKELAGLRKQLDDLDAHAKGIKVTMDGSQASAVLLKLNQQRIDFLRAANPQQYSPAPKLPTVHYRSDQGPAGIDPETGEAIERAIEKETEATKQVAARATDVYRGVGQLDTHTAGYFDRLGSSLGSSLDSLGSSLRYTVAANSGYATSGANSFKYSGNNSGGSWAGKQMTFGGNSEADTAYYNSVFGGRANRVGGVEDASSITSGATGTTSGAINVNIVVKPVMEGSRLSGQSAAEIKQAASAGANAALRAYYGR